MAAAGNKISSERPLEDLIDQAIDSAEDGKVRIGTLLDSFGSRSFGPLIALFALIAAVPPVGGIPGVPTTMGVLILLLSVQLVFGRRHPWVPVFLRDRGIKANKVRAARKKAKGALRKIDKLVGPRLRWASGSVAQWIAALCVTLLALTMPPLELLPFAAALPALAILMFGLGITARDGLLILIGFAATGGTAWLVATNAPKIVSLFG